MKASILCVLLSVLALEASANRALAEDGLNLTNHEWRINYAFGQDIVSTFKQNDVDIDPKAFLAGMQDALAGKPALSPAQQKAALKELQDEFIAKAEENRKAAAVKNLADGRAFLAANARQPGVKIKSVAAPDGSSAELQYCILKSGPDGPSPRKTDVAELHYTGSLMDGKVFDSSVKRGVPATFSVELMVPGWAEAVQMMKVGDKWQLFIPPNLAYGDSPPPGIPPNGVLIFELELLSFYTPAPAGSPPAK